MKSNLQTAKEKYPIGSTFKSATGKIKTALTVNYIQEATHQDRVDRVASLKIKMINKWNNLFPKEWKDSYKKLDFRNQKFLEAVKKLKEEVDYLSSLEKDIVNENGGVIYCSETKTWA